MTGDGQAVFAQHYEVELSPEYPPDGIWAEPLVMFGPDGRVVPELRFAWGSPVAVRVTPEATGAPWVGMFAGGGAGGLDGLYACPSPTALCILVEGTAYLLDVTEPGRGAVVVADQVHQTWPCETGILLLIDLMGVRAVDGSGVVWTSDRIAWDGLTVTSSSAGRVTCSVADLHGGYETVLLDLETGRTVG